MEEIDAADQVQFSSPKVIPISEDEDDYNENTGHKSKIISNQK